MGSFLCRPFPGNLRGPPFFVITVFTVLYCRFLAQDPMIYVHPVSLGSTIGVSMNEDRGGMKIPLNRSSVIF